MLIKFLIIPINGKKTSLQYSKSGFDEETYDFVEISNKIIHWKPSSLSYSRKELTKLTKKDIISLLNINIINTTKCKFDLIESFLQQQKLYCYESLDEENLDEKIF